MKEIAATSGYCVATVSLALRNHHSIPPGTRQKIRATARRLGYRPHPLVAALMATLRSRRPVTHHTVLGLVTTHPETEQWRAQRTFAEMVAGAAKRATELGYRLDEFSLRAPDMTSARFVQMMRARGIHGLIVNPLPHDEKTLPIPLDDFAIVGLGASVASPPIERVSNDHFQSALLAVRKCRELGYRRIGFVVSREMSERLEDRWLAAFSLLQQRLPRADRVPPLMPEQNADIPAALPAWYAKEQPDVIIFGFFLLQYQKLFPAHVGLVALSVYAQRGALSGIFQDSMRVGAIAIDQLVGRLQRNDLGSDETARLHLIAGQWAPGRTARGPGQRRPMLDQAALG